MVVPREELMVQVHEDAVETIFNEAQVVMREVKEAEAAKHKSRRMSSKDTIASQAGEEAKNTKAEDIAVAIQSRLVVSGLWLAVDTYIFAAAITGFGTNDFSG